jgi:threonine/homoserine/homoserine lactone efflux protein
MAAAARTFGDFFAIVKILGVLYLVWQGVSLWRAAPRTAPPAGTGHENHFWRNYGAGLLLMFGHVQAMLFYAALMPGFVDLATLTWGDLGLLAVMLLVVIGGVNTGYVLLAARARHFFANQPAQRTILRVAGTLMFVAAALVAARV